jgi:hypothetical protein
VNVTFNGNGPENGSPLNAATGAAALTGATVIHRHRSKTPAITQKRPFAFISDHSSQLFLLPAHTEQEPELKGWQQQSSILVAVSSVTSRFFSSTSGIVGSQQESANDTGNIFYVLYNG